MARKGMSTLFVVNCLPRVEIQRGIITRLLLNRSVTGITESSDGLGECHRDGQIKVAAEDDCPEGALSTAGTGRGCEEGQSNLHLIFRETVFGEEVAGLLGNEQPNRRGYQRHEEELAEEADHWANRFLHNCSEQRSDKNRRLALLYPSPVQLSPHQESDKDDEYARSDSESVGHGHIPLGPHAANNVGLRQSANFLLPLLSSNSRLIPNPDVELRYS